MYNKSVSTKPMSDTIYSFIIQHHDHHLLSVCMDPANINFEKIQI